MSLRLLLVVAFFGTLLWAVQPEPEPSNEAATTCEIAASLANARMLSAAKQEFSALLEDESTHDCAAAGLAWVDEARCSAAISLNDEGPLDAANAVLANIL